MNKLLGMACVLLLCASLSAAHTSKKTAKTAHHATAGKAHSKHKLNSDKSLPQRAKIGRAGGATRTVAAKGKKRKSKSAQKEARGQRAIDAERAREIQQALIREKYLDGEPSGVWDQRTKDALMKYQGDNGWQTKVVPDSRALIKLGLGPNHADLINPGAVALPAAARDAQPGGASAQQ